MIILAIDGKTFPSLPIIAKNFKYKVEILDGQATGRMENWIMFRQPAGIIRNVNLQIEGMALNSNNPEFIDLLNILDSFGNDDFKNISFISPNGTKSQLMYGASYELALETIKNGVTYWGTLTINFIARGPS